MAGVPRLRAGAAFPWPSLTGAPADSTPSERSTGHAQRRRRQRALTLAHARKRNQNCCRALVPASPSADSGAETARAPPMLPSSSGGQSHCNSSRPDRCPYSASAPTAPRRSRWPAAARGGRSAATGRASVQRVNALLAAELQQAVASWPPELRLGAGSGPSTAPLLLCCFPCPGARCGPQGSSGAPRRWLPLAGYRGRPGGPPIFFSPPAPSPSSARARQPAAGPCARVGSLYGRPRDLPALPASARPTGM